METGNLILIALDQDADKVKAIGITLIIKADAQGTNG